MKRLHDLCEVSSPKVAAEAEVIFSGYEKCLRGTKMACARLSVPKSWSRVGNFRQEAANLMSGCRREPGKPREIRGATV